MKSKKQIHTENEMKVIKKEIENFFVLMTNKYGCSRWEINNLISGYYMEWFLEMQKKNQDMVK